MYESEPLYHIHCVNGGIFYSQKKINKIYIVNLCKGQQLEENATGLPSLKGIVPGPKQEFGQLHSKAGLG